MSSTETGDSTGQNQIETSPPKKKRSYKFLSKSKKYEILSLYKNEMDANPKLLISQIVKKVSKIMGAGVSSVYKVLREYRLSHDFQSPKKTKKRKKLVDKIDDYYKNEIRKMVHELYFKNELPNVDRILKVVNEDNELPNFCRTTFYKFLNTLNFKFVKMGNDSTLIDKDEIIVWRRTYLEDIRRFRDAGRKIYFLGETWIDAGHSKTCISEQALTSTGNTGASSEETCLLIAHIGSDTGFVDGGLWIFQSKKTGKYHEQIDGESFEQWFSKILPQLEDNSVIVLDNTPGHCRRKEKIPNSSWNKIAVQSWLEAKNIPFEEHMLKVQLLEKVKDIRGQFDSYIIDDFAKSKNITVLRLPPYHSELNPIECIWAQIKDFVASNNTTFDIKDVEELCSIAIKNIGSDDWQKYVEFVKNSTEEKLWELDNFMEAALEQFLVNGISDFENSDASD